MVCVNIRDICNYCLCERFSLLFQLPQMSFAIFKWQNEFLIIITSQSTSICGTGFMISRSRLWSNFLHWRTNQLLSFHKFPQKIIASCCSNSYPQGWPTVTVLLSATFDFTPKAATQSAYKPSMSAISSWGRTTQTQTQIPWWVSSAAQPFRGVVHLTVQVFRTSTARVISWYSMWWRLSCGFLRGLECLSPRCPLLWHLKHKPNFSYNYHRLLTVDSSRFHTMSVHGFLSSQNITWVSLRMFFLLSHFDLFEFDLGFSCSGFSILLEQPKAITLTWLSVSATHLGR